MTAIENVLVGAHLHIGTNVLTAILRPPATSRGERAAVETAVELLRFVGLAGRENDWRAISPTGSSAGSRLRALWRCGRACSCSTSRRRA